MRFENIRELHAPVAAVWHALHDPAVIEQMIPRCMRVERQPGHVPGSDQDFALGFEVGSTNVVTGAEPIIGWLEVDRQHHQRQMSVSLTLNDGVSYLNAKGTISLAAHEGNATELRAVFEVNLPGMRDVTWSEEAVARTEGIFESSLQKLEELAASQTIEEVVAVAAPAAEERAYSNGDARPRVLSANERGRVVLMPMPETSSPSQGMVRRLQIWQERRRRRQIMSVAEWTTIGLIVGAIAAAVYLARRKA